MDNYHLRAIILKLQDRLSDDDRLRLHFFLGNDVPRRTRDDPSLGGTLRLMESLFDQDKINEQDFTFLINAFDEIHCTNAVKLLKEHMRRIQTAGLNQSIRSLAAIMPSTVEQLLEDQGEDKYSTQNVHNERQNRYENNNLTINSINTNVNMLTTVIGTQTSLSSQGKRKLLLNIPFLTHKCLLLLALLSIIALGVTIGFCINRIYELEKKFKTKEKIIFNLRAENNQSNHDKETIEHLNKQVKLWKEKANRWITPRNINNARGFHTATVLTNGKVLVTGGTNGSPLSSCKLYDPPTNTWTTTGNISVARYQHAASILTNGNVLVTGGYDGTNYLSSAELYDSTLGTWTTTGSMNTARGEIDAVILGNEKVLIAGGTNGAQLSSCELYDPSTNIWTTTGSMNAARVTHRVSLLLNGKVLVSAGGMGIQLSSCELYDPSSNTWTNTGSLTTARQSHMAVVLGNGKVIISGGYDGIGYITSAELYDPTLGTWTSAKSMHNAREKSATVLLTNGKAFVIGGFNGAVLNNVELYDPLSNTWTVTTSMGASRFLHTANVLATGQVLVAGGYNGTYLNSAELYSYT